MVRMFASDPAYEDINELTMTLCHLINPHLLYHYWYRDDDGEVIGPQTPDVELRVMIEETKLDLESLLR